MNQLLSFVNLKTNNCFPEQKPIIKASNLIKRLFFFLHETEEEIKERRRYQREKNRALERRIEEITK
jgi:hypothetical protein